MTYSGLVLTSDSTRSSSFVSTKPQELNEASANLALVICCLQMLGHSLLFSLQLGTEARTNNEQDIIW